MPGFKKHFPEVQFGNAKITPDEIDRYEQYVVINPTTSATWFGTAAGGTSTQAKALVITNRLADFPRNLLYSVVGTADMGGTWVVNGKDQFGSTITETVGSGTAAAGTPVFAIAGTKIFAQVTSGTFTVATGAVGNGSARLGAAIGTSTTAKYWLGLPDKIASTADVKAISWSKEFVSTTMNGGTIGAQISATTHAFTGTAIMGGTESFTVLYKPTYNAEAEGNNMANLSHVS